MKQKPRGVYFIAIEKKDPAMGSKYGINVSSSSVSIPKVCMAYSSEKKDVVMIGYDPTKKDIYVDEWGDRYNGKDIKEVTEMIDRNADKIKISQTKGKYVAAADWKLAKYLRACPFNKDVKHEANPKTTPTFYELNFEADAKKKVQDDKAQTQAKALVYASDFETKRAYCIAKSIPTTDTHGAPISDAELEVNLVYKASQEPEDFQREFNSAEIWNAYYIRTAMERGFIYEQDGGRVLVDNVGTIVKSAPVGQSAIVALAKGAATNKPKDALAIDSLKDMIEGKQEKKTPVETTTTNEDVIFKALNYNLIEKSDDIFLFEGKNLGSSKTGLSKRLEQEGVLEKLTKLVELEDDNQS
jgi:hypothetical protein